MTMTETTTSTGFSDESFDTFLASRDEPNWLTEDRRLAWQSFRETPLPKRSEEEWMRTDIRLLKLGRYTFPTGQANQVDLPSPLLSEGVAVGGSCVSVDGVSVEHVVDPKWATRGVLFGDLAGIIAQHGDVIRPHLLRHVVGPQFDKFSALNCAGWSSGAVLFVPTGVVVDEPFHVYSVMTDGAVDLGRILVILEDGAEATVLVEMASAEKGVGGLHTGATELLLAPRAHLRYVSLQNWADQVWHFAHQKAVIDRDASVQWTIGALGSRLAKVNQHVELVGKGASCQVNGTMFTEGRQHLSYHTRQHHVAPDCTSDFLYKAALQDQSRTVWRGMIRVDRQAQKTDGYQRNDNLLLSRQARADAIPGLEIEADDVRCTHGSTTGYVDEEMIFYAQSRGFTREEATRMIVTGFFQQIFDRIPIESVREALGLAIARRVREYE